MIYFKTRLKQMNFPLYFQNFPAAIYIYPDKYCYAICLYCNACIQGVAKKQFRNHFYSSQLWTQIIPGMTLNPLSLKKILVTECKTPKPDPASTVSAPPKAAATSVVPKVEVTPTYSTDVYSS